jgi:glycosyltransferase involved in cell wall biosynthesis
MASKKIFKVFHGPVNYGTQAGYLAKGLRELGVKALSFTNHDPFKRLTDFQFAKKEGIPNKILYYWLIYPLIRLSLFFRFDIFHFYFGKTLHPRQWDLPFYKLFGKKVIMHYLGNDIELYEWSVKNYNITNMEMLYAPSDGYIHDRVITKRRNFEKNFIDREYVCAPQYSPFIKDVEILALALDIQSIAMAQPDNWTKGQTLKVLHAPTSRKKKGTEYLVTAVQRLKSEGYNIELDIVEGVEHKDLLKRYENCHVSVNALLGGWYGTAGIEAMAVGRPLISFVRPEFLQFMGLKEEEFPIISANINTIYEVLLAILNEDVLLNGKGIECRRYVERFHDYRKISEKLLEDYKRLY